MIERLLSLSLSHFELIVGGARRNKTAETICEVIDAIMADNDDVQHFISHHCREQLEERKREHRQLTVTLILILIFFVFTNTPDVSVFPTSAQRPFSPQKGDHQVALYLLPICLY